LIRRQKVSCKACGRSSRLPHGQRLKPKAAPGKIRGLNRPQCPECGSGDVWRRDERRWTCRWCQHWFVTDWKRSHYELPKPVQHWQEVEPNDEAAFLFRYSRRNGGTFFAMRQTIDISEKQKADLDFLVAEGALPRTEVDAALWFRARVLEIFDGLVAEHARCGEFLTDRGMTLDANRVSAQFNPLIDYEAAAISETSLEVEHKGESDETSEARECKNVAVHLR